MAKRTQIGDFKKIQRADDLEQIVKDKRKDKRANKKKAVQRNRHYERALLRKFRGYTISEEEE
ncbi:MAG: hypothetical protein AAF798_10115 [Bacteroidota bacterium]